MKSRHIGRVSLLLACAVALSMVITAVVVACECADQKADWVEADYSGTGYKCGSGSVYCEFTVQDWKAACQLEYGGTAWCQTYLIIVDPHGECTGSNEGTECYTNSKYKIDKMESDGCYWLIFWHCHAMEHLEGYPQDYGDHWQTQPC